MADPLSPWIYLSPSRYLMHLPEPMPAFDDIMAEVPYTAMGACTTRVFALTATYGIDYRNIDGRVYTTAHAVTNPDKISRCRGDFNKRATQYIEKRRLWPHAGSMISCISIFEDHQFLRELVYHVLLRKDSRVWRPVESILDLLKIYSEAATY